MINEVQKRNTECGGTAYRRSALHGLTVRDGDRHLAFRGSEHVARHDGQAAGSGLQERGELRVPARVHLRHIRLLFIRSIFPAAIESCQSLSITPG